MRKRKSIRRILWTLLVLFLLMNAIAAIHAWSFTHFTEEGIKTELPLSATDKMRLLLTGISNPKPANKQFPDTAYFRVSIQSNKRLDCWYIKQAVSKGTVLIFHGYGGEKSSMLDKSKAFREKGFDVLLVDFMGSGASEGRQTTIGYHEAEQVRDCLAFIRRQNNKKAILFGTSMGAAAIMRGVAELNLQPDAVILECPFGTMYRTVCKRFENLNIPVFPMAGLLVFWGGAENGFWAFAHNPQDYARSIHCPAMLIYGEKDDRVTHAETDSIFARLPGKKQLLLLPQAAHENLLKRYKEEWVQGIDSFLLTNVYLQP